MRVLVTGSAGFIGFHLSSRLLERGHEVLGLDGMTTYYDVTLKRDRQNILKQSEGYTAVEAMLEDRETLDKVLQGFSPEIVVHLAAQAGVRYSLEHPEEYVSANVEGTFNVLEAVRRSPVKHLMLASTSSVYGGNVKMPFAESDRADFPVSLYAATKKAGEELSHSYSHLFKIPTTCFRFFTVYGPWGRPDMALFKFVDKILKDEPIEVYGYGQMRRDFTYISDLIEAIERLMPCVPLEGSPVHHGHVIDSLSPVAPWRVVNIAGGQPVGLLRFIEVIEQQLGVEAHKDYKPMQKGDVLETYADGRLLEALTGFAPLTDVEHGVREFVTWYRRYQNAG